MKQILTLLTALTFFAGPLAAAGKIEIIHFKQNNKQKEYNYLSKTINDAVNSSILKLKRFQTASTNSKECSGDYEYCAWGSYTPAGKTIQVVAFIKNSNSGQVIATARKNGKLDDSLFQTIDQLSEELAENLDKAVPKERIVTVEKTEYKYIDGTTRYFFAPTVFYSTPHLEVGDYFNPAISLGGTVARDGIVLPELYAGLFGSYTRYQSDNSNIDTLTEYPVGLVVGYRYSLGAYLALQFRPFITVGWDFGEYSGKSGTSSISLPFAAGGMMVSHTLIGQLAVFIDLRYKAQFDDNLQTYWAAGSGVIFRF